MKKHMFGIALTSALLGFVFTVALHGEEAIPEFDGGYLKTVDSEYVEVTAKRVETNVFETIHFVRDKAGMITLSTEEFKGIFIQGRHKFELFSLHPLLRKISSDNVIYYAPGEKIETRSKFISDNANYFQPREELKDGEYVAWISQTFWLFSLTSDTEIITLLNSTEEDARSQYELGVRYHAGIEVNRDRDKAFSLILKSAEQGYREAQNTIACYYAIHPEYLDGEKAVEFASKVIKLIEADPPYSRIWTYFSTLAVAYARNDQFEEAVATQKKAIALLQKDS